MDFTLDSSILANLAYHSRLKSFSVQHTHTPIYIQHIYGIYKYQLTQAVSKGLWTQGKIAYCQDWYWTGEPIFNIVSASGDANSSVSFIVSLLKWMEENITEQITLKNDDISETTEEHWGKWSNKHTIICKKPKKKLYPLLFSSNKNCLTCILHNKKQWVKPPPVMSASHPAVLFESQVLFFRFSVPGKAVENGLRTWGLATHGEDQDGAAGAWLQPGLPLTAAASREVN